MSAHDETSTTRTAISAERVLLAVAVALLLLMNGLAVGMQIGRPLDHDEAEYLHAAWLMEQGKRIYRDFMEDHPPFLFQLLQGLQPRSGAQPVDVFHWAVRGRIFTAVCGTWAMMAAGLIVWRITRSGAASAVTLAALLGAYWTWLRGLADIRADAPTLALFMTGFLLVIWDEVPSWRMAWRIGLGIALAIAAEIWNPKWPLEGLCLGVFYLVQLFRLVRVRWVFAVAAIVPTLVVAVAAYGALVAVTSVDDYLFFNFLLKSQNAAAFRTQSWIAAIFRGQGGLHFAPPRFAGVIPAALYLLTLLAAWREWRGVGAGRAWRSALVLAMTAVSALSVRFLFAWPHVWPQFFLMPSFLMAMTYGLLAAFAIRIAAGLRMGGRAPDVAFVACAAAAAIAIRAAVVPLLANETAPWTAAALIVAVIVAAAPVVAAVVTVARRQPIDVPSAWRSAALSAALVLAVPQLAGRIDFGIVDNASASWPARQEMMEKLRPGDTVWISAARHPIAAHDASYYWYSFPDLMPMTLDYVARNPEARRYLPALTADDLPICRLARGEERTLRFIEISAYADYMPGTCPCAQAVLLGRPGLVPTRALGVYEIVPAGSAPAPAPVPEWDAMIRSRVATCGRR